MSTVLRTSSGEFIGRVQENPFTGARYYYNMAGGLVARESSSGTYSPNGSLVSPNHIGLMLLLLRPTELGKDMIRAFISRQTEVKREFEAVLA